ncbi:hypothetical protein LguiB_026462 [Lonicera macranthoides]
MMRPSTICVLIWQRSTSQRFGYHKQTRSFSHTLEDEEMPEVPVTTTVQEEEAPNNIRGSLEFDVDSLLTQVSGLKYQASDLIIQASGGRSQALDLISQADGARGQALDLTSQIGDARSQSSNAKSKARIDYEQLQTLMPRDIVAEEDLTKTDACRRKIGDKKRKVLRAKERRDIFRRCLLRNGVSATKNEWISYALEEFVDQEHFFNTISPVILSLKPSAACFVDGKRLMEGQISFSLTATTTSSIQSLPNSLILQAKYKHRGGKVSEKKIIDMCNPKPDMKNKVHSIIDKFAECGLRSLVLLNIVLLVVNIDTVNKLEGPVFHLKDHSNMKSQRYYLFIKKHESLDCVEPPESIDEIIADQFMPSEEVDRVNKIAADQLMLSEEVDLLALMVHGVDLALVATHPGSSRGTPLYERHTLWSVEGPREAAYPKTSRFGDGILRVMHVM